MREILDCTGTWYKGNLHTHTQLSDGKLAPSDAIAVYRDAGYDFIALTDHWVQSTNGYESGLLTLSGCEFDMGNMIDSPIFHIVGIGMDSLVALERSQPDSPQQIIDAIKAAGGMAILAHPAWSVTIPADCMDLEGLNGIEIFNTVSGMPWNSRADSSVYVDIWATQGKLFPCIAADDCHYYAGDETRSFIMVNAPRLEHGAIKQAIVNGNFYASQGPRFQSISCDESYIEIACSEVETIIFYSNTVWCGDRVAMGHLAGASYEIKPTDTYVRIELIDYEGNHAWCSPFAVG